MKSYIRFPLGSAFAVILSMQLAACSSTTKTTTTRSSHVSPDDDSYREHRHDDVEQETTTTTTEDSGSCGGILSCTVDGVGFILALPFKLVGGLIDVIF